MCLNYCRQIDEISMQNDEDKQWLFKSSYQDKN